MREEKLENEKSRKLLQAQTDRVKEESEKNVEAVKVSVESKVKTLQARLEYDAMKQRKDIQATMANALSEIEKREVQACLD